MKKTLTILIALMLTIAAEAQTLSITTASGTTSYSAADLTSSTPVSFSNGTTMTIGSDNYTVGDITSSAVGDIKDNEVHILYNGTSAAVLMASNVTDYVTATISGAHVTIAQSNTEAVDGDELTYVLSGTTSDGSFTLGGSYKCTVSLAGLTMTNPNGGTINITNSKRIQLSAKKNTTNTLTDGSGSQKACVYSKGQLQIQGNGVLNVAGNYKHAIKSASYIEIKNLTLNIISAVGDGINCEEYLQMKSGTVTISGVGDDGIQCDLGGTTATGETTDHEDEDTGNIYLEGGDLTIHVTADAAKAIKAEGDIRATGTNVTATTSGGGLWDADELKTKSSSCMSADANMLISGGTLLLTSTGAGGKGINADGNFVATGGNLTIKTSGNAVVASSSGTLSVVSSSQQLDRYDSDYKSSPKGIKVDGTITISDDAVISVTTSGAGGEGIESKTSITFNGGQTYVSSSDDGINASYNTTTNGSGDLIVNGGYIYCISSGNDAMDSNGNFYVKGGLVYAIGCGGAEKSLDANTEQQKKLYISGGTLITVGDLESGASITGGTCKYTSSWSKNSWFAFYNGGTMEAAFKTPATGSNTGGGGGSWSGGSSSLKLIVYTSSTPTLTSGVTVSGGTDYFGGTLNIGGTVSGGSNVTLSNYTSSGGGGGRW
jgi:hypothetical protein